MKTAYAVTIGCSAFLLFSVQPMTAKALLPRFGGSAGVWVTCMVFFQVVLLLGYLYAYALTRIPSRKAQSAVHVAFLVVSLATFSFRVGVGSGNPAISIFENLALSIGLPYFLLSATNTLLQSWFANYRLFALSNAASLAALLAYPVVIEPFLHESHQRNWWRAGYVIFAALACATAVFAAKNRHTPRQPSIPRTPPRPLLWIGLAACSSTLWLAVANHLSQEVAPIPFLWILPLSIYLLSFILCFEGDGWYRPALFRWLLPAAWIGAVYRISIGAAAGGLIWEIAIFSIALFIWCMFCHGEIARTKPAAPEDVARFYLMIALGGAIGAVFVGLAAPNLLSTYLELPLGITASVFFALRLLYGMTSPWRLARLAVVAGVAFIVATRFQAGFGEVAHLRNFYGALQVSDSGTGETAARTLYNGRTLHGVEFLSTDRRGTPTAYYGPNSGAGKVLLAAGTSGRRAAMVGLGVGTLAAYGRRGDIFRFYEINPAVIDVASRYFHFLGTSEAKIDVIQGDGRLALEREPPNSFDLIVLDAFADDSIPVHLLTREAFAIYFRLLRNDGVLAIHLTNRYLDLAPVVEAEAAHAGKRLVEVHSPADPRRQILAADWVIVSGEAAPAENKPRLWTDDYSNLFQVLK